MKLLSLHVNHFGKISDFDMDFKDGWNPILKDNGWGKTTLAVFIKAMLFGISRKNRKESYHNNEHKKYEPWSGGTYGGTLDFETDDGEKYRIHRTFLATKDNCSIENLTTGVIVSEAQFAGENSIGEKLFGIGCDCFERTVYFFDLPFLNDDTGLISKLQETTDQPQASVSEAKLRLENEKKKLHKERGDSGKIDQLIAEENRLNDRIRLIQGKETTLKSDQETLQQLKEKEAEAIKSEKQAETEYQKCAEMGEFIQKIRQKSDLEEQVKKDETAVNDCRNRLPNPMPTQKELAEAEERKNQFHNLEGKCSSHLNELSLNEKLTELEQLNKEAKQHKSAKKIKPSTRFMGFILLLFIGIIGGNLIHWACYLFIILALLLLIPIFKSGKGKERQILQTEFAKNHYCHSLNELQDAIQKERDNINGILNQQKKEKGERNRLKAEIEQFDKRCNHLSVTELSQLQATLHTLEARWEEDQKRLNTFIAENHLENVSNENIPQDIDQMKAMWEQAKIRLKAIQTELAEKERQIETLRQDVDTLADLADREAEIKTQVNELEEKYKLLEKAIEIITKAEDNFSSRYLVDMKQSFGKYLHIMDQSISDGSISAKLDVTVMEQSMPREMESQSAGRQKLYQFALRLALTDALWKNIEEKPFLILDDPFTYLDENHLKTVKLLQEELKKKYQILYFTCHPSRL